MLFTRCWLGRTKIQQGTVFREELNLCSIKLPNSAAALERSEISTLSSRKPHYVTFRWDIGKICNLVSVAALWTKSF